MPLPFPATLMNSSFPKALFAAGEQGVWYDPSDFTTMFQDAAGTTPVTAVEQPVGKILDKSGRGNHASQSTTTSRPVLSARVNLLTYTEVFSNAVWVASKSGAGAFGVKTNNYGVAPDGTTTAARIQLDVSSGAATDQSQVYQSYTSATGVNYTMSVWIKTNDGSTKTIKPLSNAISGTITVTGTWTCYSVSLTSAGTTDYIQFLLIKGTTSDTADLLVWHPDVRATNDGVGLPPYQRVGASTDYDTAGFPYYLKFDGTDDSLATSSIDFSATDKVSVFAGVRKLSDAAAAMLLELSADTNTNNGAFFLTAPSSANYVFNAKGTTFGATTAATVTQAAPDTAVLTATSNISGPLNTLSRNGAAGTSGTDSMGTGNFGNYPLYIGRRGGSTLPYNGRIYSLIIRGAATTTAAIQSANSWVNNKTKAY